MSGTAGAAPDRVAWVDDARGIGIALVVVGHTLPGLWNAGVLSDAGPARGLVDWIYSFHMPLFFFLSGLFAVRAADAPLAPLVATKLRTIAYPYVVWSVIQTLAQVAVGGATNHPADLRSLLSIAWAPIMQFWFLYALFLIALAAGALQRAGLRPPAILVLSVALYVWAQVGSLGPWGVPYTVANNMLYFAAGMTAAAALPAWLGRWRPAPALAVGVAGFAALALAVAVGVQAQPWLRPVLALLGIAATLLLSASLASALRVAWLAAWGRESLAIFVAHSMASAAVRIVLLRVLHVAAPWPHVVLGVAAGLLLPLALARACERLGFRYAFTWPSRRPPRPAAGLRMAWEGR